MVVQINRKIVKDIINKINSIDKGVVFLYGESGSGKTYIIETLNEVFKNGNLFKFEDYNGFDNKNSGLLIQIEEALNIKSDITNYNTIHAYQSKLDNIEQKTQIIFDNAQIREKFRSAFNKYNKPIIFLDAIENIIQGDRIFMEEMIDILLKNSVKVIITSRGLENKYNTNSFNITHFNQEEFDEFVKENMPCTNGHIETIKNLCIINDNYYNNISLSLLYTLYIEDKEDLFWLIADINKTLLNVFGVGGKHLKCDRFTTEIQERILKKILGNNDILTAFLQKTLVLKSISKTVLDKVEISYSLQEWDSYVNFIRINGSKSRLENGEIENSMHDCIYSILYDFFNDKLTEICKDNEIYSSLLKIVEFWIEDRKNLKIEIGKLCKLVEILKPFILEKENEEAKNILFIGLGYELYSLGWYKEAIENYEEAKKTIQEILKKNSENDSIKNVLAGVYMNLGVAFGSIGNDNQAIENYEEAKKLYEKILKKNPENNYFKNDLARVYVNLGTALNSNGKYEEAIENYEEAKKTRLEILKKNTNNDTIKNDLAKVYMGLGNAFHGLLNYEKAIENYEEAKKIIQIILKINPENNTIKNDLAKVYIGLGNALHGSLNYEKAIENYEVAKKRIQEILNINPDNDSLKNDLATIYLNLGVALYSNGKYEEAIKNYENTKKIIQEILKKNTNNDSLKKDFARLYMNLGVALYSNGKYEEAIENFKHGLNTYPKESGNFINLFVICLIRKIKIEIDLRNMFLEYHGNSIENMAIYDMLKLFEQTYNGDDYSILFQKWLKKYEGVKLERGWTEIQNWIEIEDSEDLRELLKKFQSI